MTGKKYFTENDQTEEMGKLRGKFIDLCLKLRKKQAGSEEELESMFIEYKEILRRRDEDSQDGAFDLVAEIAVANATKEFLKI